MSAAPIVVLLNRDLRLHDHPALADAARRSDRVVPLFVLDPAILRSPYGRPNRVGFLVDALGDLRDLLRERGADLVVRRGDPVREAMAVVETCGARAVHVSDDVSGFARRRAGRLAEACAAHGVELRSYPGITVVPPADLRASTGNHYRVFTPYWRAWQQAPRRRLESLPRPFHLPSGLPVGRIPPRRDLVDGAASPDVAPGGESAARRRLDAWCRSGLERYGDSHDDPAADATSRLSPYLHFGCLSPLAVLDAIDGRTGSEEAVRQLCWRDFFHQQTEACPEIGWKDYRPRPGRRRRGRGQAGTGDDDAFEAWAQACTGYPFVDAGLRQLRQEGWMHNRARLVTASFLVKDLGVDWPRGARHFLDWLVDGDIANNSANWQWVAGTGADTRPNRVLNPLRQAERFDPDGDYVRRYVPELASVEGRAVHRPWTLGPERLAELGYPPPIVDHDEAVTAWRAGHGPGSR